jgi:hypothetical protein
MKDNIKISKSFTVKDWKELRPKLLNSEIYWEDAYQIFEDRINSRFFNPIEKIKTVGKNEGEGFSIALILVVLLETLAAFELGKIYKTNKAGISPCEYYSGINLLKDFLKNSKIFAPHFKSYTKIQNFYENIRCGLVHEARTLKNDVIISNNSPKNTQSDYIYFNDNGEGRLNRDLLLLKIKEFIDYNKSLIKGKDSLNMRKNFILKMDEISGLKHVWYFVYGSNLLEEQLFSRLNNLNEIYLQKVRCSLDGYKFIYNKKSIDGTSKGNIEPDTSEKVEGIAVLILENKLNEFIKKWEKGYEKLKVSIIANNKEFKAYTCISYQIAELSPSEEYVMQIINGAKQNGLPQEYIEKKIKYKS